MRNRLIVILFLLLFSGCDDVNAFIMKCPSYLLKYQKIIGYRPPLEQISKANLLYTDDGDNAIAASNLVNPKCWNICQNDENCIGYVLFIDSNACYGLSVFDTNEGYQQKLTSNDYLIPDANTIYFEKVCLKVPDNCHNKLWIITKIPGNSLVFQGKKTVSTLVNRRECAEKCLHETEFQCLSASFAPSSKNNQNRFSDTSLQLETLGRCILSDKDKTIQPDAYRAAPYGEEYIENQCYNRPPENDNCSYEIYSNSTFLYSEIKYDGLTQKECQNKCSHEKRFYCQGASYYLDYTDNVSESQCLLHSEDLISMGPRSIKFQMNSVYMRRVKCLDVSVVCTKEDMVITYIPKSWFRGKLYVSSHSNRCAVEGNGTQPTVLRLQIGNEIKESRCGILRAFEVKHNYQRVFISALVVVQNNLNVQTQGDRLIKVGCILSTDQDMTPLALESSLPLSQIDLPYEGSIAINSSNIHLPKITLQIVDLNEQYETSNVKIGQNLELQIQAQPPDTPYDYEVTSLSVKSTDQNTTVHLIDENGCPVDVQIFPALEKVTSSDTNMLRAKFHAFKFADGILVSFDVKIRFCLFKCPSRTCDYDKVNRNKRQSNTRDDTDTTTMNSISVQIKNPLYISSFTENQRVALEHDPTNTPKQLDVELPLNYKLFVRGPHKLVDATETDAMVYGENGIILLAGNDHFSSSENFCFNQSLLIAILIFWIILQILLIICCCYVINKYKKLTSSRGGHKSFTESFEDYEGRRVHWADQGVFTL